MITVAARLSGPDEFGLDAPGDFGFACAGDHVDFAADAEGIRIAAVGTWEIEAGFHGEAGVGEDEALVVGFEIVEVSAVSVELGADVVAGAMSEKFTEAGFANDIA